MPVDGLSSQPIAPDSACRLWIADFWELTQPRRSVTSRKLRRGSGQIKRARLICGCDDPGASGSHRRWDRNKTGGAGIASSSPPISRSYAKLLSVAGETGRRKVNARTTVGDYYGVDRTACRVRRVPSRLCGRLSVVRRAGGTSCRRSRVGRRVTRVASPRNRHARQH